MITQQDITSIIGSNAVDADGDKLGKVGQVYLDDQTGSPEWATVSTGMFGTSETFVPLTDATVADGTLRVPYQKSKVKDAPRVDADQGHLSPEEETELYRYYGVGVGTDTARVDTARTDTVGTDANRHGTVGHDTSGPTTDDAMTRSEEQIRVGTQQVEAGRARLRKYVVTEEVTTTVPVSHEEVRLEREPITDANRDEALAGPAISEEEHEVVLHAERPVVAKETVPVERVRLETETVTEQETVTDTVRKEQIESDVDGARDTDRR
ncbi:PRC and DUF2382 domain-containing protein [Modestobacter sp. VKM Ac-2979]|uniref:PRC and DUF2382 domain-containing protein n=1 Tax=unclassified Modestobacter TaxID=2643866 RepID=UPI0022ABA075|nr:MULTISPECIES: PRC and DUF2382 domain-containing protein [unclassified Modestobacter]MCZ2813911.1 PRC and DUF2382 domain-containing protein [Modestobacter sp. VKM Ac-2979]MCZ2844114.1 PRC and DUF2382 domain-containing protein [Modestobacter sp. VKM Ac-2980]